MTNDIRIVIGFCIALVVICKLWNLLMMKQYDKAKKLKRDTYKINYECYDAIEKLNLVGIGIDENGDYNVTEAIKNIELPDSVRIKVNE